jgi:XTP/dITP diphosphohydrolase
MKLIFATQNEHKIAEIRTKLPSYEIKALDASLFPAELEETGETLEENALQKARQVYQKTRTNCFADDSGLEVVVLHGEPGVYSARYAGSQKKSEDNMNLLLQKMQSETNRKAHFKTVIALIWEGEEYLFEGICKGSILHEKRGKDGFGYDPIFVPEGYEKSFAEMTISEKSAISHRGKAVESLVLFLETLLR